MKKVVYSLVAAVLVSCVYHDIPIKPCYLASEETLSDFLTFHYNSQDELISYSSSGIASSILTYNGGKIVSEVDNEQIVITYTYDTRNRLTLWSEATVYNPTHTIQTKFFYNEFDQDTLQQYYKYDGTSGNHYLWRYTRLDFASVNVKNYSKRRVYDAATDSLLYTEEFLWDNHHNPYLTNAFFLNEPPPTNNMIQHTVTLPGYDPQTYNYEYTYNEKRFPLERRVLPSNFAVTRYTYTNCH